jgi:hypothetical protein
MRFFVDINKDVEIPEFLGFVLFKCGVVRHDALDSSLELVLKYSDKRPLIIIVILATGLGYHNASGVIIKKNYRGYIPVMDTLRRRKGWALYLG